MHEAVSTSPAGHNKDLIVFIDYTKNALYKIQLMQRYLPSVVVRKLSNMLSRLNQAAIGSRLNPQSSKPKSPPWFEGWYTRVIGSEHSFGLVTGYFPEQNPKHPAFYTGLLFNEDSKLGKLTTFESYSDSSEGISISRGPEAEPNLLGATEAPDFCVEVRPCPCTACSTSSQW